MMFNLTKQERQAVLFLLAVAILGTGINLFLKINCKIKFVVPFNENLGKVNLNKADKDTLMGILGFGEKLSGRVLSYRKERERFNSVEELKNIKGISERKYEKLKSYFYVE